MPLTHLPSVLEQSSPWGKPGVINSLDGCWVVTPSPAAGLVDCFAVSVLISMLVMEADDAGKVVLSTSDVSTAC